MARRCGEARGEYGKQHSRPFGNLKNGIQPNHILKVPVFERNGNPDQSVFALTGGGRLVNLPLGSVPSADRKCVRKPHYEHEV